MQATSHATDDDVCARGLREVSAAAGARGGAPVAGQLRLLVWQNISEKVFYRDQEGRGKSASRVIRDRGGFSPASGRHDAAEAPGIADAFVDPADPVIAGYLAGGPITST